MKKKELREIVRDKTTAEATKCPYCNNINLTYEYPSGWYCVNCDEQWGTIRDKRLK